MTDGMLSGDVSGDTVDLDDVEIGPVDYLIVEFPGNKMTGEALPILVDLVDRGIIRILDFAFVTKDADGNVGGIAIQDLGWDVDVTIFEGIQSGMLDEEDLAEAASIIEPNCSAGVLVYENRWAGPFAAALRRSGAELVASGRIPVNALLQALATADESAATEA
jgi:hypothetical protein